MTNPPWVLGEGRGQSAPVLCSGEQVSAGLQGRGSDGKHNSSSKVRRWKTGHYISGKWQEHTDTQAIHLEHGTNAYTHMYIHVYFP